MDAVYCMRNDLRRYRNDPRYRQLSSMGTLSVYDGTTTVFVVLETFGGDKIRATDEDTVDNCLDSLLFQIRRMLLKQIRLLENDRWMPSVL